MLQKQQNLQVERGQMAVQLKKQWLSASHPVGSRRWTQGVLGAWVHSLMTCFSR